LPVSSARQCSQQPPVHYRLWWLLCNKCVVW
jgi:hypothetical protein